MCWRAPQNPTVAKYAICMLGVTHRGAGTNNRGIPGARYCTCESLLPQSLSSSMQPGMARRCPRHQDILEDLACASVARTGLIYFYAPKVFPGLAKHTFPPRSSAAPVGRKAEKDQVALDEPPLSPKTYPELGATQGVHEAEGPWWPGRTGTIVRAGGLVCLCRADAGSSGSSGPAPACLPEPSHTRPSARPPCPCAFNRASAKLLKPRDVLWGQGPGTLDSGSPISLPPPLDCPSRSSGQ